MGDNMEMQLKKLQIKQDSEAERLARMEQTLAKMSVALSRLSNNNGGSFDGSGESSVKSDIKISIRSEMSKFDGTNVHTWIYKANKYLRFHGILDDERITVATFNMKGETLDWLVWADKNNKLKSWSYFVDDLIMRFGSSTFEIPVGRLSKLIQTTRVKEYQHQFEAMANKVDDISPQILKEMFIAGLKMHIQKDVLKARPNSVVEVFALAQLYEQDELSTDLVRFCPQQN